MLKTMGILLGAKARFPLRPRRSKIPTRLKQDGNLGYLIQRKGLQSKIPNIPKIPIGVRRGLP